MAMPTRPAAAERKKAAAPGVRNNGRYADGMSPSSPPDDADHPGSPVPVKRRDPWPDRDALRLRPDGTHARAATPIAGRKKCTARTKVGPGD
ncbi:hypothetical protein Ate02nite_38760 [Paractinoplanes tereljensis]|uniref:Uncharacterized protein n=1 Tax=Paractinoplanes tereljensis TaxID=571912 RepID=A0A919NNG1_9ACTN|nr:hypothetical protein Ate02nite_38760 [Actinoplanes tereljensis]